MTLPIVRDPDGELRTLYTVRGMPISVFIERDGEIFTIWAGMLTVICCRKLSLIWGKSRVG